MLIVGAGTGNDVAVALSEGAQHVDAVEIDPMLLKIGRSKHPNHPYDSPRVTTHSADGRAFLQNTRDAYNLILFALPDSLTAVNGQSSLRLESYLLTLQSVQAARARLAPGGTMAMYNYYAPYLFNRYATTMAEVFHRAPCAQVGPPLGGRRLAVLTDKPDGPVPDCASVWRGAKVAPATDDHPFPYLAEQHDSCVLLVDAGPDPGRPRCCSCEWAVVRCAGCSVYLDLASWARVHAAGDQEHRRFRVAVRQYLASQRTGHGGHPGGGLPGGGDGPPRPAARPWCCTPR